MDISKSFTHPIRAAIIGASGGIGKAFIEHLQNTENVETIYAFSRSGTTFEHPKTINATLDFEDEATIETAAKMAATDGPLNLIIVATGMLHDHKTAPEKSLRDITPENFSKIFATNTIGPALIAKHFLKTIPRNERAVFAALSARVGSISDNALGGWYAYRASKAALNMVIKTASIEITRRHKHAIIIGLHPGTVDTDLSDPFQSNVPNEKLFTPAHSSQKMLQTIATLTPQESGYCFAYNGQKLPT